MRERTSSAPPSHHSATSVRNGSTTPDRSPRPSPQSRPELAPIHIPPHTAYPFSSFQQLSNQSVPLSLSLPATSALAHSTPALALSNFKHFSNPQSVSVPSAFTQSVHLPMATATHPFSSNNQLSTQPATVSPPVASAHPTHPVASPPSAPAHTTQPSLSFQQLPNQSVSQPSSLAHATPPLSSHQRQLSNHSVSPPAVSSLQQPSNQSMSSQLAPGPTPAPAPAPAPAGAPSPAQVFSAFQQLSPPSAAMDMASFVLYGPGPGPAPVPGLGVPPSAQSLASMPRYFYGQNPNPAPSSALLMDGMSANPASHFYMYRQGYPYQYYYHPQMQHNTPRRTHPSAQADQNAAPASAPVGFQYHDLHNGHGHSSAHSTTTSAAGAAGTAGTQDYVMQMQMHQPHSHSHSHQQMHAVPGSHTHTHSHSHTAEPYSETLQTSSGQAAVGASANEPSFYSMSTMPMNYTSMQHMSTMLPLPSHHLDQSYANYPYVQAMHGNTNYPYMLRMTNNSNGEVTSSISAHANYSNVMLSDTLQTAPDSATPQQGFHYVLR